MNFKEIVRDVLLTEAKELEKTANKISFDIEKAIDLIVNSKGKLIVTGVGKSGLVGAKIAATLASTGTSSFFLHPTEAMHGDLGMIGKDDIVVNGGTITITSTGDGLKSTEDEDTTLGYVTVNGGTINIISGADAIQGETTVTVSSVAPPLVICKNSFPELAKVFEAPTAVGGCLCEPDRHQPSVHPGILGCIHSWCCVCFGLFGDMDWACAAKQGVSSPTGCGTCA